MGVQPAKAGDPAALARRLAALLDVDAVALQQRVQAASPDAFVPVITLRRSEYEPLRARLQPLPGTVFREPRTHAWTIGFQGGVAFAALVEDGRSGGAAAVPVAEAFLRAL